MQNVKAGKQGLTKGIRVRSRIAIDQIRIKGSPTPFELFDPGSLSHLCMKASRVERVEHFAGSEVSGDFKACLARSDSVIGYSRHSLERAFDGLGT